MKPTVVNSGCLYAVVLPRACRGWIATSNELCLHALWLTLHVTITELREPLRLILIE